LHYFYFISEEGCPPGPLPDADDGIVDEPLSCWHDTNVWTQTVPSCTEF